MSNYPRGSEWRRWDLHVHTKNTLKNDAFASVNFDEFCKVMFRKALDLEICAIGITDYFCIDNYKRVVDFVGRVDASSGFSPAEIEKIKKIFVLPNVELRMLPVTDRGKLVNIHCVFSPDYVGELDNNFFAAIKHMDGPGSHFLMNRVGMIGLGKSLDSSLDDEAAYKLGVNSFVVSHETLQKIHDENSKFRENVLFAVSNSNNDGASAFQQHYDLFEEASPGSLDSVRRSIYRLSNIIFSGNPKDIDYFLGKKADLPEIVKDKCGSIKPCIHGSDAHSEAKLFMPDQNRYCWIKADPTFEGLKQIIYEPEDRVKIQPNRPENKAGYQIIDRIEIQNDLIYNNQIHLNPNLNSIIGGRSSGKSILLGAIAKKVKPVRPFKLSSEEYQNFIQSISDSIKVFWKDDKEENEREIEYFEQGYMNDIAREKDGSKLNKIIQEILIQKGKEHLLNNYKGFTADNSKETSSLISDYFRVLQDINEKEQNARDKGDQKGIEDEIKKLSLELQQVSVTATSDADKVKYEEIKESINKFLQLNQTLENDIRQIEIIKATDLFKDNIDYELSPVSETIKENIKKVFESLKVEAKQKWEAELEKIKKSADQTKTDSYTSKENLEKDKTYIVVSKAFNENKQLSEYETKIKNQNDKLFEIKSNLREIESLRKYLEQTKEKIKKNHKAFFEKISEVIPHLSDSNDGLTIKAKYKFEKEKYQHILSSSLNLQSVENQKIVNIDHSDYQTFEKNQFELFEKLIQNKITLKGGYDNQNLSIALLSANFYSLTYDIEYENDNFMKMSDGKKAFVVLKLLLDFNDKNCPILIDQPEDDLDNRSIYNDLVHYISKKKKMRQIIVATHNPNIVVGGDSEVVICANQQGEKNKNNGGKKFQYVTGSLECTYPKITSKDEVLASQGIREHVCEVLEGGNIAFKLREKKYSIKE